jgi:hypothetical protein
MITKGRDVSRYAIALALLIFTCAALAAVQPQTLQGEIMFLDRETGRMWLRPQGAKAARPGKDVIVFVLPDTELRRGKEKLTFKQLELGAQALVKVRAWKPSPTGEAGSQAEAAVVEILKGPGKTPPAQVAIFGRMWQIDRARSLFVIREGKRKFEVLLTPNAVITDDVKRLGPLDVREEQLLDVKAKRNSQGELEAVHIRVLTRAKR